MTYLFISTLKGVAFEWFMKLPVSSIKTRADLKKLFLVHFFKDVTKVAMPTLLDTKQKKESPALWRDFRVWHSII